MEASALGSDPQGEKAGVSRGHIRRRKLSMAVLRLETSSGKPGIDSPRRRAEHEEWRIASMSSDISSNLFRGDYDGRVMGEQSPESHLTERILDRDNMLSARFQDVPGNC
ncbi:MAG TPA: hypothetical protein EYP57_01930 [Thermodesulfobacteriaceae bacterium]|nr:hypothetical protein [Thermodesulfobacteriaceae bacterium]